jgi:hypothetical protein
MQVQSNFAAVLSAVPDDDWIRTWAASKTIMLSMTSKGIKELLGKMRLPVDVYFSRSFWNNNRNGNSRADEKIQLVTRHLNVLVTKWNINSFELTKCIFLSTQELLGVVAHFHSSALTRIVLNLNKIDEEGAEILAGVLTQCPAVSYIDISNNNLCDKGVEILAIVFEQCKRLAYLNLKSNNINNSGAISISENLPDLLALTHLDLSNNWIENEGIVKIAEVISMCPTLVHVNLCNNMFEYKRSEYEIGIEKMFEQCGTLSYYNIESKYRYDCSNDSNDSDDSDDYI